MGVDGFRGPDGRPVAFAPVPAREPRDSLLLRGTLRIGARGATHEVRIRNLSERGLMADHVEPLDPGTRVTVEMRGIGQVSGAVAWSVDGRIGVALDRAIDPRDARKPLG